MDFSAIVQDIKQHKLAGRRYQKEGHGKFRDCLTICRNGKFVFERYCYGEAAGKVCEMLANRSDGPKIEWEYSGSDYSLKTEAPVELTGQEGGSLLFDGKKALWELEEELKQVPKAGLTWFRMLLGG